MVNPDVNTPKNFELVGTLISSGAEAAPMEKNHIWSRGSFTHRVQLQGLDNDARFFLSTMNKPGFFNIFKKIHAYFQYVTIKVNGKEVLVNINSIAKRLLLTKKETKQAHKDGRLEELIQKRVDAISKNKDLLNQLEYTDQTHSEAGVLQLKATQTKVSLTAAEILASGWHYVKDDKIHKVEDATFSQVPFAQGTFAKIVKFDNKVMKLPKERDLKKAKTQATNEQRCLVHLSKLNLNNHAQKPYHALRVNDQVALVGSYIEGTDLTDCIWDTSKKPWAPKNIPNSQKTAFIKQLINFFRKTVIKGSVCHNDISPSNIRNAGGNLVVIDFGNATIINNDAPISKENFLGFTGYRKEYSDPETVKNIIKLRDEGLKLCTEYDSLANDPANKAEIDRLQIKLKTLRKEFNNLLIYHNFHCLIVVIGEIITGDKVRSNESFEEFISAHGSILSESQSDVLSDPDEFEVDKMNDRLFDSLIKQLTKFKPEELTKSDELP